MKKCGLTAIAALIIALPFSAGGAPSDWLSAPKPTFPTGALSAGSEGSVNLRVLLAEDGHVLTTTVLRSSGDRRLDRAAQQAVSQWRMKPSAIKRSDLATGRDTVVEFKQEALLAAVYPDRTAYFSSWNHVDVLMFAPFPAYPVDARRQHHTGKVLVGATIGKDGSMVSVHMLQSSGHNDLDQSAIKAVRLWRAHKQFAGKKCTIPINFTMGGRHS